MYAYAYKIIVVVFSSNKHLMEQYNFEKKRNRLTVFFSFFSILDIFLHQDKDVKTNNMR